MRAASLTALQALALLGAAALCALVSNRFARPERRLAWTAPPPAAAAIPAAPAPIRPEPAPPPPARPDPGVPRGHRPPDTPSQAPAPAAPDPFPPRPGQPLREISSLEAEQAFGAQVPFLDARRSAEYELGHIAGAWSLPVWEGALEARLVEFEAGTNRPPEAPLVLYCSGGGCEDSHLLASRLFRMGYRNLLIYREGYPDWEALRRPLRKGAAR